jgi:heme exporter protein C
LLGKKREALARSATHRKDAYVATTSTETAGGNPLSNAWHGFSAFFGNPHAFMKSSAPWAWGFTILGAATIAWGLYGGLYLAPVDFRQLDASRIMFVHVPSMWLSVFAYAFMVVASFISFVWRSPLADVCAKSAAPIGAAFTALGLITGSIWGKPIWNTWWEWDARITSVLLLFFIYLGYIAIWNAMDTVQKAARAAAIVCLVGAVNLPIIHYSVDWWNTLHQKSTFLADKGPARTDFVHAIGLDQAGNTTFTVDLSRSPKGVKDSELRAGDTIATINGSVLNAQTAVEQRTLVLSGNALIIGYVRDGAPQAFTQLPAKTPPALKYPMYVTALGYLALFGGLTLMNMRAEIFSRRAEAISQRRQAAA